MASITKISGKEVGNIPSYLNTNIAINIANIATVSGVVDTHITSTGSTHTYIDQDVTVSAAPTFSGVDVTGNLSVSGTVTGIDIGDVTWWPTVGSGAQEHTLAEYLSHTGGAYPDSGFEMVDNLDGTVTISGGSAWLRDTYDVHTSSIEVYQVDGDTTSSGSAIGELTNNATNYIFVNYNSGSPELTMYSSVPADAGFTEVPIWFVTRIDNEVHVIDMREFGLNYTVGNSKKDFYVNGYQHKVGGSTLSETGTRNIILTAGAFYLTSIENGHIAFDTSVSGVANENTFTTVYQDNGSGWTRTTDQKQIDNTYYDDDSGTLATLGNSKWGVHWVYLILNVPDELRVIYGRDSYASVSEAQAAGVPANLPPECSPGSSGILIGKIIIQEGAASFVEVASPFKVTLISEQPTSHNALANLQGGAADEYYHLTSTEHGYIDQDVTTSASPTFSNLTTNNLDITDTLTISGTATINGHALFDTSYGELYENNESGGTDLTITTPGDYVQWQSTTSGSWSGPNYVVGETASGTLTIGSFGSGAYTVNFKADNQSFPGLCNKWAVFKNNTKTHIEGRMTTSSITVIPPTGDNVVLGTTNSGSYANVGTINSIYHEVNETGNAPGFDIRYYFTAPSEEPDTICFFGRYDGLESHNVEVQVLNITTVADSGTAESGGNNTLTDTDQAWETDEYEDFLVVITGGTGVLNEERRVTNNNGTVLTVESNWTTNPSSDTTYEIRGAWNETLVSASDLPASQYINYEKRVGIVGTLSNYYDSNSRLTTRIYHTSAGNGTHVMYTDFFTLTSNKSVTSVPGTGILTGLVADDVIDLRVTCNVTGAVFTTKHINLNIHRINR